MIRVKSAEPVAGAYKLHLVFTDGSVKEYDFSYKLNDGVFRKLQDRSVFENVSVRHGTVTWDDDRIDFDPETLYAKGAPLS
ncbi:hypothetical protein FACS1894211_16880 [Clostridia bacterium]|nr:hypothetical protein FACS1894211_16880 [Clostridia bacterium]